MIVRYLLGAMEVLPKADCQLLLEFAEIEKNLCQRLHREVHESPRDGSRRRVKRSSGGMS